MTDNNRAMEALQAASFAAIDFETATEKRGSACALAVTVVDGGRISKTQ